MRKLFLSAVIPIAMVLLAAAPSLAETRAAGLLIDWGDINPSRFPDDLESVGLMVRLSNPDTLGGLYLDTGLDYNEETVIYNIGLTLRSPRALFIFRPYAGWGLSYNLTDLPPAWNVRPYMLFGSEFLWLFWEEAVSLYPGDPALVTRTGIRVRF